VFRICYHPHASKIPGPGTARGLLDELELHIVPVILANGMRLLGPELGLDSKEGIELTPVRVIATPDVTHIRYQINGRRPLVLDNRGRDEEPAVA